MKSSGDNAAGLDPDRLIHSVETEVDETETWLYCEQGKILNFLTGCAVSILAGVLAAWISRKIFRHLIGKYHTARKWKMLNALMPPVIVLGVLISCFLYSLPMLKTLPERLYELDLRLFYAAAVLTAAWGILRLTGVLDQSIRRLAERQDNSLDHLTVSLIGSTLKIAIAVTALLFIGQNIFDLNITALLASAGVIGLAVALAAKETVSNFIGTIVIIADCPFRVGDRIESGKINGIVTHIGLRSSKILTEDESVYTVPNSILTNSALCNLNRRGCIKHILDIGLTYDTTPAQMRTACRILHEIMDNFHGPDVPGHSPHIFFSGFGAYSLNLRAILWLKTASFAQEEELRNELNLAVLQRFNDAGLSMAYPTQTVLLSPVSADQ